VSSSWLVVGHGSVGAFLAGRLDDPAVYDPAPRLPVTAGHRVTELEGPFAYAVSCVPPAAAVEAARLVAEAIDGDGIFFEWNTTAAEVKRRIAEVVAAATVDVALLDSLDGDTGRPMLAVSGPEAGRGAAVLRQLGFDVNVVGDEVGEAARLKYLRSIFMKTLEALALEYTTLAAAVDTEGVVRESIARNLGERFDGFLDLLVETNRVHGARRAAELADAVASFDLPLPLAQAAAEVLRDAASVRA
jgi:hypothetical protein